MAEDPNRKLLNYSTPKGKYHDRCEVCGKEFDFTDKDVKDRVFICPYCKHDMIFFKGNYK